MEEQRQFVINIVSRDRTGIVADVSEAIFGLGGRIEAVSQTVVFGWFTMIIHAEFAQPVNVSEIRRAVEGDGMFSAIILPSGERRMAPPVAGDPFVITVTGENRAEVIPRLTRAFASKGINIVDLWNELSDDRLVIIFHVVLPASVDPRDARYDLEQAAEELGVTLRLQHQDIFTATNSLSVHTRP